jgi:hypothetical protein
LRGLPLDSGTFARVIAGDAAEVARLRAGLNSGEFSYGEFSYEDEQSGAWREAERLGGHVVAGTHADIHQ